jgi:hypothetical protein
MGIWIMRVKLKKYLGVILEKVEVEGTFNRERRI